MDVTASAEPADTVATVAQDDEARLVEERAFLEECEAALVVADIPGLPLRAAKDTGRSALAVANFSWDWIYRPFIGQDSAWSRHVEPSSLWVHRWPVGIPCRVERLIWPAKKG